MPDYLDQYRNLYRGLVRGEGPRSRRRQARGFERLEEFDPREYARETAGAIYGDMSRDFERGMSDLRSSQVATGRVRSGFGQEDENRYVQDFNEQLSRQLARVSQQAAGQQLRADQAYMGAAQQNRNRYYDLLAGGMDREIARRNAEQREKGGLFGGIGSLVGGLAGNFLLPGIGAKTGAMLGGAAGEAAAAF